MATGTLAVDRMKSKDKEKEADFIPVVIWNKQAESTAQYSGKGKLCAVAGRIQVRNYDDKEGNKRYVTEIIADEVQFLEFKSKDSENGSTATGGNAGGYENFGGSKGNYGDGITPVDDSDSEIPF